ncbi:MAG: serine/threonine protein kinase [Gammaproteobacteria bacterium]|nr:serine/threonine protein kinase [Gammaproteobacteria bacterium]
MSEKTHNGALPENHLLHWYRVQRVLGQGAFGITYLALDVNLDRLVAIKEYMPGQMAARAGDLTIKPLSDDHREDFQWGLTRFVAEARTLTKFEHPNLVRVLNVFELHGTAYMVMNYELGESLQEVLKREKRLGERRLIGVLVPLMDGLEVIHARGFVHRDIKPGNIFIRSDGSPVLLDFGSARQTRGHADPQTLTTLVSPGYAPIEQYTSKSDRQGPWTDIYGLAATLYRAVLGSPPSSATDRSALLLQGMKDDLQPLAAMAPAGFSKEFLAAIDHGLGFRIEDRPQNVAAWRREFALDESQIVTQPGGADASGAEAMTEKIAGVAENVETFAQRPVARRAVDSEAKTEPAAPATVKTQHYAPGPALWGRKKWALVAAGAVVLIGVSIMLVPDSEEPAVTPAPEAVQPVMDAAPGEPTSTSLDETASGKVAELLALAEADLAALRLTSPKGNNAFEHYQAVLDLEPGNEAATNGMQALSQRYVDLAYGAMAKDKLDDAAIYLVRAGRIEPSAESLPAAKAALSKKFADARAAAESDKTATSAAPVPPAGTRPDKRTKRGVPVEDRSTSSERVKKSLGEN